MRLEKNINGIREKKTILKVFYSVTLYQSAAFKLKFCQDLASLIFENDESCARRSTCLQSQFCEGSQV